MGKIIGVISLKGGAGKTSVVTSLGSSISDLGKKVLLIDGNLSSPSLGLHLNIVEPQTTLHHVLTRNSKLKDAIYEYKNFHVMPSSIFEKIEANPLALRDKIKVLKKSYDVILIDSAPSLDNETLGVILASDQIIAVTTPDHPSLSATIRAVKLAKQRGTPIIGIILNKVHDRDFEIPFEKVEDVLGVPILAVIPYDTNVLKALSQMEPPTAHSPKSKGSLEFKKLAGVLVGEKYTPSFSFRNFFGFNPAPQEVNREIFYQRVFSE